jgi:hypothetical protein
MLLIAQSVIIWIAQSALPVMIKQFSSIIAADHYVSMVNSSTQSPPHVINVYKDVLSALVYKSAHNANKDLQFVIKFATK